MKKCISFLATFALGVLCTASVSSAWATNNANAPCEGGFMDEAALRGQLIVLESNPNANPQAASATPAVAAGETRTVILDGIVMELPEEVIEMQVANGTFIVVYAGTTYPMPEEEWPCWLKFPGC